MPGWHTLALALDLQCREDFPGAEYTSDHDETKRCRFERLFM